MLSSTAQELAQVRENDRWGYIDPSGNYAISPRFLKAGDFSEGYAPAFENDKWGFIDVKGDWAIKPMYEKVKAFNSGYALVYNGVEWKYVDPNGKELQAAKSDKPYDFEDGVALIRSGELIGLMNTDGKVIIEPSYLAIKSFIHGHARVKNGDKWGMIDNTGKLVIPMEYDHLGDYSSQGICAGQGTTKGLIIDGAYREIPGVDKIWNFSDDSPYTYARKNDLLGFIDNKGEWLIEPKFVKVRAMKYGLAPVYNGKLWGYVNEAGEMKIDYKYPDAEVFSESGLAPVKEDDWGFINKEGVMVIPPNYGITSSTNLFGIVDEKGFIRGLARVKYKKTWGYLDDNGNPIGGKWFKNAEVFSAPLK